MYHRHRPTSLDQIVGNTETVLSLKNYLKDGTLPHAVLFTGPFGSGKTTTARILKDELDCSDLDFKECNAAQNRGIEFIREIQGKVGLAPASGPVRVWLLDEAHELTPNAQSAALKMTEDIPNHTYFFLATSKPHELDNAFKSRFCPMPFRSLGYKELEELCDRICDKEKITLDDEVKDELVASAQGSARLLLVLLDKVATLTPEQQKQALADKVAAEETGFALAQALIQRKPWNKVAELLKNITEDPETVRRSVLGYARKVLLSNNKDSTQAFLIIGSFRRNFYDGGAAELAASCYESLLPSESK